ncbi:MAG TPA: AAA family ATPase [Acidimicrobiales bacterium]|nr:AAA family ATPase [Acidimicrobiales bacterium]
MVAGDAFEALFEAVRVSPGNVPLRRHLADALLAANRASEAEHEYRAALKLAPDDDRCAVGLADAFFRQGRHHEGLAVLESRPPASASPAARLLAARLHLATGALPEARACYLEAVAAVPELAEVDLSDRLGVRAEAMLAGDVDADLGVDLGVDLDLVRSDLTFADVGGMDDVKEEVRIKILAPLQHPELFSAFGKAAGGGILMYGPPGCGKTHLARATAGELGGPFIAVGLHEILDMWIGQSERNLHEVFDRARRNAPSVLFFDEVDALGASRADMRASGGRHLINQFLSELDGVEGDNESVLVLAATNAPWYVDSAFRRPGRFDRILFVPPPDAPARAAILRILCAGKPVEAVDYDRLAARTDGFSGADLAAVVDRAVEAKLRAALRSDRSTVQPLTAKDLAAAARSVTPSTREWFATARNWATHANAGGVYDAVLAWLDQRR